MTVVVKLGGSLFDLEGLAERVRQYVLTLGQTGRVCILAGGGRVVDAVRFYDGVHGFSTMDSHWLSVDLMHVMARMVNAILPEFALVESAEQLAQWCGPLDHRSDISTRIAIVSPLAFYSRQLHSAALPIGWDTTSDSIAALLARIVEADRLVLLKSTGGDFGQPEPIVDANFWTSVAGQFPVQVVNFRMFE